MKASKLKKDKHKTLRINEEVLSCIESSYGTLQKFIDAKIDEVYSVDLIANFLNQSSEAKLKVVKDNQLVFEKENE